ncbi:hypothetical protein COCCADRAFT_85213 [Bipolaris zeicola 26-R-13]|uniref:GST N-terminal domain-containing protein n=1 Tax=Cochliobolus carbonum (strain 26-R-13) TaxID=930089 RepID=W6YDM2_COCC2|nr:uncharacterized protein COCCADRAFT_85213 [Bipolaris zeicola 26-R-13]EUC37602.1 hypothetical protein COCCADRAFT_85213 [Bipolaris zeicola 26-R-13]
MSSPKVTLFDLPSRQGTTWSLNPWKTRIVLNYKSIPYKTEWVEYPDLAPKFKALGIPPNPEDAPGYFTDYSSPAIQYEDGTYQMDSWPIAHSLEKQYPNPPLHLEEPIVVKIRDFIKDLIIPLVPLVLTQVPDVLLNEPSAKYFLETRKKTFGKPLDQVRAEADVETCWAAAAGPAKEVGDLLREKEGPFFLGETVSYADFIFVTLLQMFKRIDQRVFERYMALDETFPKVFEACQPWMEKQD